MNHPIKATEEKKKKNKERYNNTKDRTPGAQKFIDHCNEIPIIPPKNGSSYTLSKCRFLLDKEGTFASLNEREFNLAKILEANPKMELYEVYIRAGYSFKNYLKWGTSQRMLKGNLTAMAKQVIKPEVTKVVNSIKKGTMEELVIDAAWLLNEQVLLFEECKRSKLYNQAIKLLDSIAGHVDVDAKASNKISVEPTVDYAKILSQASIEPIETSIELTEDSIELIEESIEPIETSIESTEESIELTEEPKINE